MVQEGFGRHRYYMLCEPTHLNEAMKYWSIWPPTFIVAVCLTRISICCFLLRIFNVKTAWLIGLYAMIVFILVTDIPTFVFIFISCNPFEKQWKVTVLGRCWGPDVTTNVGLYNGVVSQFIDWVLATLPIVFLWDMLLSVRAKVGVCILIGMGFFTGVTSIVRTVMTKRVIEAGKTSDFTWIGVDLRVWGQLEILIGIIAACIPAAKPFYTKAVSSLSNLSRSRGKSGGKYVQHSDAQHHLQPVRRPVEDPYSVGATKPAAVVRTGSIWTGQVFTVTVTRMMTWQYLSGNFQAKAPI